MPCKPLLQSISTGPTLPPTAYGCAHALWGLDWNQVFPLRVAEHVVASRCDAAQALAYIKAHREQLFDWPGQTPWSKAVEPHRLRYCELYADMFALRSDGEMVGLFVGEVRDWSTYYIRSVSLLPGLQGRRVMHRLLRAIFAQLAEAGVRRVEASSALGNRTVLQSLSRLGFDVVGQVIDPRWGAMTEFCLTLGSNESPFARKEVSS